MLDAMLSRADADWLYAFFFNGNYPLALQLGIINTLCVISIVLMRTLRIKKAQPANTGVLRTFAWIIILANFLLIVNKDFRFIDGLT